MAKKTPKEFIKTVKKELTPDEQAVLIEKERVDALLAKGWYFTQWGELAPPQVEINNSKGRK